MDTFLHQILKLGTIILFFSSFFLFSHIFYLFGIPYEINLFQIGGYEGLKSIIVVVFGIFYFLWLLLFLKTYKTKNIGLPIAIGVGILISSIFSIGVGSFLLGLSEKHQGGWYYLSLLFFYLSIYVGFHKKDYYDLLHYIFILFIGIFIYSIVQIVGYDPLSDFYQTRVSIKRVFSTLGNANYLAGLALILIPLTQGLNNKRFKNIILLLALITLMISGSYFGIFLAIIYIFIHFIKINRYYLGPIIILFFIFFTYLFHTLSIEKLGSLKARPYIWKTTILAIVESPKTILIGHGPDTLQLVFNTYKVPELNIYETSTYTADRSHNIFLDLIYFFGIFGGGGIIFFILYGIYKTKTLEIQHSIILFLIFFSFNIPVTIHFILLLFLLAGVYKKIW